MKNRKMNVKLLLVLVLMVMILFLTSYGFFYANTNQNDRNRLAGGCFNTSFTDGASINLTNAFPVSFEDALNFDTYDFTISNTCDLPVKYYILLNVKNGSFDSDYIDYSLNEYNYDKLSNTLENTRFNIDSGYTDSFIIGSGLLENGSITHNLRIWIDEAVSASDLESRDGFTAQIKVVSEVSSMLGTNKIKNLAADADESSTDVIDKGTIGTGDDACTNTLAYDGTVDNNLRYVGQNPCNYVSFNNELWRIIGVMNNVDDGTGKRETKLKLIRRDSLGAYSWDSSIDGNGENNWAKSKIMQELNGDYLNTNLTGNTLWYGGSNNTINRTFDYTKVLKKETQSLIDNNLWYLKGGVWGTYNTSTAANFYSLERNGQVHPDNPSSWVGKVGLLYLSDFGFAVGNDNSYTHEQCLNTYLYDFDINNCNHWLVKSYNFGRSWTMTAYPNNKNYVFFIGDVGQIGCNINISYNFYIRPVVNLKSNVKITGGVGSQANPYTLG